MKIMIFIMVIFIIFLFLITGMIIYISYAVDKACKDLGFERYYPADISMCEDNIFNCKFKTIKVGDVEVAKK